MFDVLNEEFVLFFMFFLCTIQRKEISLIVAKARPLAAKFCTITKKTPCALTVLIMKNKNKQAENGRNGYGI